MNATTKAGGPAVHCRGLVKRYDQLVAVDHLDLEVAQGECFGLLGPNGAGKTTTIEILEGLLAPDDGQVEVLGLRWGRDDSELRQRLGIQLQETQFSDKLTVREIVRLFRSFYRQGRDVDELLARVELEAKRDTWYVKLSGGQKQRLAVACALVGRPDMLFLDEPTTGLDPQSRRQFWELLGRFRSEGGTILITTHYMEEAQALCDRVAVVDKGRVIALGTPRELIQSLGADHVIEFSVAGDEPPPAAQLAALPGVRGVRQEDGACRLIATEVHVAVPALLDALDARGAALASLATHTATLEDVFVSLTGRHLRNE